MSNIKSLLSDKDIRLPTLRDAVSPEASGKEQTCLPAGRDWSVTN